MFLESKNPRLRLSKIVSGGAKGVDSMAAQYAQEHDIELEVFYPDWTKYGRSAGYRRNVQIVDASDELFIMWDSKSKGTKLTIDIAKKKGKPCHVHHVKT